MVIKRFIQVKRALCYMQFLKNPSINPFVRKENETLM